MCDLFLDTMRYTAMATAVDVLYAGVPLITLTGTKMVHPCASFLCLTKCVALTQMKWNGGQVERGTTSLLHAVGLPQLALRDLHEYEEAAVTYARFARKGD